MNFSLEGQKIVQNTTASEVILLFPRTGELWEIPPGEVRQSRLSRSVHPGPWSVLEESSADEETLSPCHRVR